MIRELADLARIVTSRGLANFPLMDLDSEIPTKENQLIVALRLNPAATKSQLIREVYGANTAASKEAFWQLCARVLGKLLNHLYFLDHTDKRHLVSRRYEMAVLDMLHQAIVLVEEGESRLAVQRLRRCLLLAERDDFLHYAILAARHLRNLYANLRRPQQYKALTKKHGELTRRLALENEAEELYLDVRNDIAGTVLTRQALLRKFDTYIPQLEQFHQQVRTANTFTYLYRTRLTQQEMLGNYAEILRLALEAIQQLEEGQLNPRRFDARYTYYMTVYAHLRLKQLTQGLMLAEQYLPAFHPSSNNWFAFQENYLLLALYAGNYEVARQIQVAALANSFYPRLSPAARERWELYGAYVDFLLPPLPKKRKARPVEWTLTLPDFNRDKRGYHVAILVLQFLHYLRLRKLDEVMLRLERLRKYQQTHLREDATLRSRLFIRLLALLVEKDFNAKACAERGQNLLTKLLETPQPGEAYAQIEIVPYEALWELVLKIVGEGAPLASVAL